MVESRDVAGNATTASSVVTRSEVFPPEIRFQVENAEVGRDAVSVSGTILSEATLVEFLAGFDEADPSNFVDVLGEVGAGRLLEVALHVDVVHGAADVLEDRFVAHQQVAVLEAVCHPDKFFLIKSN